MKLNKFLLLSALTMMMSSVAISAEVTGTESGGGGDAVEVEGQLILRDLAANGQLVNITNIVKFLENNTQFHEIIYKIAKVNSGFATQLVNQLLTTRIYTSPEALNLLPYKQTTVYGSPAEVQLAIRIGDDIILAPKFFESQDRAYIMIHEALHGLLKDNKGAFHHQRVRNIVRYIYENIDNLDAKDFSEYLNMNNYKNNDSDSFSEVWNDNLSDNLRCVYYSSNSKYIFKFKNITCPSNNENDVQVIAEFLKSKFPSLMERYIANYNLSKKNPGNFERSPLEKKESIFKKGYRAIDISMCKETIQMEKEYTNYKKVLNEKMILSHEINTSLKTLTDGEEDLATWYFKYDDYVLSSSTIQNKITSNDESLSKIKKYISSCYTYYKNDL